MGSDIQSQTMKIFISISALLVITSARPQLLGGHGLIGGVGHGVVGGHGLIGGVGHGVVRGHGLIGGVGHSVVGGHGLIGGLGHGAVGGHGLIGGVGHGVVGHAVHAAEIYPDEITPYTYQYSVADDYSGSNFQ